MEHALLKVKVQEFIKKNEHTPLHTLVLKGSPFPEITIQEIAQQIEGRTRTRNKLPLWYQTDDILYPPKLNLEQTSSESTALYKSNLIEGDSLLDLTGGFGIDSYYFAQRAESVTYVEINNSLVDLAKHNFKVLKAHNIKEIQGDSIDYLKNIKTKFDNIYIDPARRSDTQSRVFLLEDCTPNVVQHLDLLLSSTSNLWIKSAPMLDISSGLRVLRNIVFIHIIAVKNEVKELLWHLSSDSAEKDIKIVTVNLDTAQEDQHIPLSKINSSKATYDFPQNFLYEPNAALLKSGAFQWISTHFNVAKLHEHTHLYTSRNNIDFPGRNFVIESIYPYSKRLKKELNITKAHITTRNFRLSVQDLRKQLKIQDGGDTYLFFTTQMDDQAIVLVCSKI